MARCDKNCALTYEVHLKKKKKKKKIKIPNYCVGNKTNILHRISNVDQLKKKKKKRTLIE